MKIHSRSAFGRIVSFMLVVVMLMSMIAVGTFTTSAATSFTAEIASGETITVTDSDDDGYYEIYTADELEAFSVKVTSTTAAYRKYNAILMADIVYNEGVMTADSTDVREWSPIGGNASGTGYRGDFNGNNHSISGLYHSSTYSYRGFVGYMYDGTVRNLTIRDSYICGANSVAGIVARNGYSVSYYGTVENCASINNTFERCSSSYGQYYGGIVGFNYGIVNNCYSDCTIICTRESGGVVGKNQATSGAVSNCYSKSSITASSSSYIGGVMGYKYAGSISNCYYLEGSWSGGLGKSTSSADTTGQAEVRTAEQFASGQVAYELQYSQTEENWGQTIGEDEFPLLYDDKVYYTYLTCASDSAIGYTNVENPQHNYVSVVTPVTKYERGYTTHTCSICGEYYIDSYVDPTNVSGDILLFEKLASDGATLTVNSSYAIDEAIYVTAANGVWVGLYPSTVTAPENVTDAIYTYQLNGTDIQTFDLRTGEYNSSNSAGVPDCLNMGETYNIFLFSDSEYTVAASASFAMTGANEVKVSDSTYIQTNKKTYTYGESIYVNAYAADNTYAWLGVYPKDSSYSTTPAEYILYIGSAFSTNYGGVNADLINDSRVHSGADIEVGDYDVYLFGDKSMDDELAKTTISVKAGYVSTDKETYGYGENIYAKADIYDSDSIDISNTLESTSQVNIRQSASSSSTKLGEFPDSGYIGTLVRESGGTADSNFAYVNYNGVVGYVAPWLDYADGTDVKITGTVVGTRYLQSTYNTGSSYRVVQLAAGTPFNVLSRYNNTWIRIQVGGYTGYLYRNTATSLTYNTLLYTPHDNSNVPTVDTNAWVGLYDTSTTPSASVTRDTWYTVSDFAGQPVILQSLASGNGSTYAGTGTVEVGDHTLSLFGDSAYSNLIDDADFTVSENVTGSFKNGAYKLMELEDGFANGTVVLELSDDSYGYIGTGDVSLYWADAEGNILDGYAAIVNKTITAPVFSFDMYPHTLIPEGAESIVAYVSYNGVLGATGYQISFPDGSSAYENLDENILSEFQIVSDLHITSSSGTANTNYQAMLADIIANSPDSVGIFVNGDVTEGGLSAEYEQISLMNSAAGTVPTMYVTMGDGDAASGSIANYAEFAASLGADVTAEKPYYSTTVNGYKYIFLAGDVKDYYGQDSAALSTAQLTWLDAELSDAETNYSGKPVFIFLHQPVADSVAGSFTGQWAADKGLVNADELKAIVSEYNNVYLLNGHSHYDLNSENNHNPGDDNLPVTVNTSAVSSLRNDNGTVSGSQGFYVRIYEDKVVFLGRDFSTGKWIPSACYVFTNDDVTVKTEQVIAELGDMIYFDNYVTNTLDREIVLESTNSDILSLDDDGNITCMSTGTAEIIVYAKATDTEVVTKGRFPVKVVEVIDNNYYLKGSYDNWAGGTKFADTDNPDVINATVKLGKGAYDFRVNTFESWFGSTATVTDATDSAVTLNEDDDLTLIATGGTYTFTYTISTNTLEISYTPANANIGGDEDLYDKAMSTAPYIDASKESYQIGESIFITADGGVCVGIYTADVTDYTSIEPTYLYNIEGIEGAAYDITSATLNNTDDTVNPSTTTGSYQAVLFSSEDKSQVLDTVTFNVVDGNYIKSGNNILSTNKTTYYYGEPIYTAGWTNRPDLKPWVCIVEKDVVPTSTSELLYWYYLPIDDTGVVYESQNIIETSVKNTGVTLEPGTYDVWLYRTSSYKYPNCCLEITVLDGDGTVNTSKDTYGIYEDIVVNANYPTAADGAWVGVFAESTLAGATPTDSTGMVAWYYLDEYTSNSVILQDLVSDSSISNPLSYAESVAGDYSVYLFGDSTYADIQAKDTFTISQTVTGTFSNGAYYVDNLSDGFANGTVVLEVSPDSLGAVGTADVTLYWADAQGTPLDGYTSFHKHYIDKTVTSFKLSTHTIIPEGAEALVAYMSSYKDTISTEGYVIPLPANCATYEGLDENIISEFQIISDLHINSDAVTTYPDGTTAKYEHSNTADSNANFEQVLNDIAANSTSSAGIFIDGSITNNGLAEEFAQVNSIYNSVVNAGATLPSMYVTMGNHDTYVGSTDAYVDFATSLGADISTDKLYYSKTINGYKYIFLAGDDSDYYGKDTAVVNNKDAQLSSAQLEWLEAELLDNEQNNSGKPVFVLLHQGVENTVAGTLSSQGWDGLVNADEFKDVVSKYNNVILVSGHSHWLVNSSDNLYAGTQDMPVSVNAGSTSYLWTDYENKTTSAVEGSQGFYVRTYNDKVVFLGRDFTTGEWIPDACFVLYNQDVYTEDLLEITVGEKIPVTDYATNLNGRDLTFVIGDESLATVDANGTIDALYPGDTVLTVYAAATDTEVLTIQKVALDIRGEGYPSKYAIKGTHNWDTDGDSLIFTANTDIVQVTIEYAPGTYQLAVTQGENYFGTDVTVNDATTETLNLTDGEYFTLVSQGGYHTFTYSILNKTLDIEFEPLDLTETGENEATIYVDFTNSDFDKIPNIYIWEPERDAVNKNIGPLWPGTKLEGPNADGFYYRTFKFEESYQFVITDGENLQTEDSIVHTESEVYVTFTGGTEYTEDLPHRFWIDLVPLDDTSDIDILYPYMNSDGYYYFYLPTGVDTKAIEFGKTDHSQLIVSWIEITNGGSVNVSGGVNKTRNYVLGGDFSGKFRVKQSSNIPSLYTYTDEQVPVATDYLDNSTSYSSSGSIMMKNSDMTTRLADSDLTSITSCDFDFDVANAYTGRYSFEITLPKASQLITGAAATDTYTLISLSTDEARMRNMTAYDLAAEIGINYYANYEVVDFYNDGRYIGTYLLVAKDDTVETVEINDVTGDAWDKAKELIYNSSATYEQLSEVIDVESFAKVYLLLELAKDADGNFNVYEKDGKFFADVVWDNEYTFGQLTSGTASVSGIFAENANQELNNYEGWWINSMTDADSDTLTVLAALCQNEEFWNVVKAEFNEVFYDAAISFANATITSASGLTLKFSDYYTLLKGSTAIDEHKWTSIASDLLASLGVNDTGDTYDKAVIWFNNFFVNRLSWMHTDLFSTDYDFATPTLTVGKDKYRTDETIVLTATCASSGMLTYNFYDGERNLVESITTDTGVATYSFITDEAIDADYTVVVTTDNTISQFATATAHVYVEKFELELSVDAPESVPVGKVMTITASTNVEDGVLYYLKDSSGEIIDGNYTGVFEVIASADEAGVTFDYTVEAKVVLNNIEFTDIETFSVEIINFNFTVSLSAPESIEKGMKLQLNASANSPSQITYTFYEADTNTVIDINNVGSCLYKTYGSDKDSYKTFYVVAETTAYGVPYTAKSDVITVNLIDIENVYYLTVYFKSTSTLGYTPMITTQGAAIDVSNEYMERDIFICKNATDTASYFWYKTEIAVSQNSPSVFFSITSSRYAMEVHGNLIATGDEVYYFAVDNLNSGIQLIDLTEASEDERNWCESAVHMVYDPKFDSEDSLAEVTARVDLRYVGDTDADGKVNIRDATYIQKFLADLVTMNPTSLEVADVDCDEKVTIKDATALQKKLAGISYRSYT